MAHRTIGLEVVLGDGRRRVERRIWSAAGVRPTDSVGDQARLRQGDMPFHGESDPLSALAVLWRPPGLALGLALGLLDIGDAFCVGCGRACRPSAAQFRNESAPPRASAPT